MLAWPAVVVASLLLHTAHAAVPVQRTVSVQFDGGVDQEAPLLHMPSGQLRSHWVTPTLQLNVAGVLPAAVFDAALHDVLDAYDTFTAAAGAAASPQSRPGAGQEPPVSMAANEGFYDWQRSGVPGSNPVNGNAHLRRLAVSAAAALLTNTGLSDAEVAAAVATHGDMFMWASVHTAASSHLAHTHGNSLLSGVLYLQVPPGSGPLVLDDPRGPRPPFANRYMVQPAALDVVVFPSWLSHAVAPSVLAPDAPPRVSVSFNLPGSWTSTLSDLSVVLPSEAT